MTENISHKTTSKTARRWSNQHKRDSKRRNNCELLACKCPKVQDDHKADTEQEPSTECFWPTILESIRARWAAQHLGLTRSQAGIKTIVCAICYESELIIPGLQCARKPKVEACNSDTPDIQQEDAVLLACGHELGMHCAVSWKQSRHQQDGNKSWSCPICRVDLNPPDRRCVLHCVSDMLDLPSTDDHLPGVFRDYRPDIQVKKEAAQDCEHCREVGVGLDYLTEQRWWALPTEYRDFIGRPPGGPPQIVS